MPWMLKLRFDLPILEKYVTRARRFLSVTRAQVNARFVSQDNGNEHKDIVSELLKAKDSRKGHILTTPELISEAEMLLIAGQRPIITSTRLSTWKCHLC